MTHVKSRVGLPLAALTVLALAAPSGAAAATSSFAGSCNLRGGGDFSPGVKFQPSQQTGTITMTGNCTGGAGRLSLTTKGPIGCTGSPRVNTGSGTLTVGSRSVPVNASFDVKLPIGKLRLSGERSGAASGDVNFGDPANGMQMTRCPGQGLNKANFSTTLRTTSALVSGSDDAAPPAAAPRPSVRISLARSQRSRTARSRGSINVRCRSSRAGSCRVQVRRRGSRTILASGSRRVGANRSAVVRVRLTRAGRRALQRSRIVRGIVRATAPGAAVSRSVTFRR